MRCATLLWFAQIDMMRKDLRDKIALGKKNPTTLAEEHAVMHARTHARYTDSSA